MVVVELLEVDAEAREYSHEKEEILGLVLELATSKAQSGGASAEGEREGVAGTGVGFASAAVAVVGGAENQGTGVKKVAETAAVVRNSVAGEGDVETGEVVEGVDEGEEADGRAVPAVAATALV